MFDPLVELRIDVLSCRILNLKLLLMAVFKCVSGDVSTEIL